MPAAERCVMRRCTTSECEEVMKPPPSKLTTRLDLDKTPMWRALALALIASLTLLAHLRDGLSAQEKTTPSYSDWYQLGEARDALVRKSALATRFLDLKTLVLKNPPAPERIADTARLPREMRGPFVSWWQSLEHFSGLTIPLEGDSAKLDRALLAGQAAGKTVDAAAKTLAVAIERYARKDDVPFVLMLDPVHRLGRSSADMATAISDMALKHLRNHRDEVLAVLLVAIREVPGPPETSYTFAKLMAVPRDPRALPALIDWFRAHPDFLEHAHRLADSARPVLEAIYHIDSQQGILRLYFDAAERFAAQYGAVVPAETKTARRLKQQLMTVRPGR